MAGEGDKLAETRRPVRAHPPWPSAGRLRRLGWRAEEWAARARASFEAELEDRRGFLWLPVVFGLGILAYFALPGEPVAPALAGATLVAAALAARAHGQGRAFRLLVAVAVFLAGATAAKLRIDGLAAPPVPAAVTAEVEGRVVAVEERAERRPRLVLDRLSIARLEPGETPARVRISLPPGADLPPLGARIAVRARLMPVPGPALPGGYDARRAAFFDGIGASGFTLGAWREAAPARSFSPLIALDRLRQAIGDRIGEALPGQAGAVATALLVGERGGLSAKTTADLRGAGLAHVLAISGLHMALVAGTTFFLVRALLALSPRLALTRPIRKWAALAGLLAGIVYLGLSGASVATVRAFIMAAVMFTAMLLDRPAISMRNLAIAAFIVLATQPESVQEPGFQMSFAAVACLIAGWEAWRSRPRHRLGEPPRWSAGSLASKAAVWIGAIAFTTLIASAATGPFAAFHFQRVAVYGLLGNVLAMPVVSLVVMPFGVAALALMPFGLEQAPLAVMGWGIEIVLAVADWVTGLEGAVVHVPPMSGLALALIALGMMWLCLWRRPWRLAGIVPLVAGLALAPLGPRPDVLVSADGTVAAVRGIDGVLRLSGGRAGSFLVDQWLAAEGRAAPAPEAMRDTVVCDPLACHLFGPAGERIAHVRQLAAFHEDCRRAALVVTPLAAPPSCAAPLVIDSRRLERFGAHAIHLSPQGEGPSAVRRIRTAWPARPRPWHQPLPRGPDRR